MEVKKAESKKTVKKGAKKPATKTAKPVKAVAVPSVNPSIQAFAEARRAMDTGKWLIASIRIENGTMTLDRTAMNFPKADIELACKLFVENLQALKAQ